MVVSRFSMVVVGAAMALEAAKRAEAMVNFMLQVWAGGRDLEEDVVNGRP